MALRLDLGVVPATSGREILTCLVGFILNGLPDRIGDFVKSILETLIQAGDERILVSLRLVILDAPVVDEFTDGSLFVQPVNDLSGRVRSQ